MTAQTTDDRTPDSIRDAFEAMIEFFIYLLTSTSASTKDTPQRIGANAAAALRLFDSNDSDLLALRDLIQRAAEEHNRRAMLTPAEESEIIASAPGQIGPGLTPIGGADMPAERIREMRERCDKATPGPWAVRDEGREGIGIDQAGINNIGSDRFILNEGANGTRADLDFAAHAREDLPAAIAEIERLTADVATLELKLADAQGEHGRLTAELAARAPADRPEVDAEDLWTDYRTGRGTVFASDRKAFLAGVAAGRRTREPDMGAADASRSGLTGDAWTALARVIATLAENDSLVDDAIAAAERAGCPDATVLHLHEINDALYRRRLRGSRPGLTEEQADAIALGCLQVREDLQRHAIKRAILRVDRGETGPAAAARAKRRAQCEIDPDCALDPDHQGICDMRPPGHPTPTGLTSAMHAAQQRRSVPPASAFGEWPDEPRGGLTCPGCYDATGIAQPHDPRATLHAGDPPSEAPKRGPSGVRVTGELDTPWGRLPILDFGEDKEPSR